MTGQPPAALTGADATLLQRSLTALRWNYLGVGLKAALQLAVTAILARLLGPEAFGLVGAALLVVGIANLVGELGYGPALIQREFITELDIRVAFSFQVATGLALAALVAGLAPWIAGLFGDDGLRPVLYGMSAILVLQPLGVVSANLLRRQLRYRDLQLRQTASYVVGYVGFGIPAALAGLGVWSLVAAQLTQSALNAVLLFSVVRHPVRPAIRGAQADLHRFSRSVIATNFSNWIIENADNLIVGAVGGPAALGLYSVAYNLVRTPTNHLVTALQGVLFPAGARSQREPHRLASVYRACVCAVTLVALPTFVGVAVLASTLTSALYGARWTGAAPLLVPLALAMPAHAIVAVSGPFLWALGRVEKEFRIQAVLAPTLVITLWLAARHSPILLGWGVAAIYCVRAVALSGAVGSMLGSSAGDFLRMMRGGAAVSLVVALVLKGLDAAMLLMQWSAGFRLLVAVGTGALCLVTLPLLGGGRLLDQNLRGAVHRMAPRLPSPLRSLVARALAVH